MENKDRIGEDVSQRVERVVVSSIRKRSGLRFIYDMVITVNKCSIFKNS